MNIFVIGLGLIGGSIGLALRGRHHLTGYDRNPVHARRALELGLVHDVAEWVHHADIVVLCIPVDAIRQRLPEILDRVSPQAVVIDTGSTKRTIGETVRHHPKRRRFVACHPVAGTEFSGPEAARAGLFQGKTCIVIDSPASDPQALEIAQNFWTECGMSLIPMSAEEHDRVFAVASHLPHTLAFALAQTVGNRQDIWKIAGSGLSGAVRLARSSPQTWSAIFADNAAETVNAIDDFILQLNRLKVLIRSNDTNSVEDFIRTSNSIIQTTGPS